MEYKSSIVISQGKQGYTVDVNIYEQIQGNSVVKEHRQNTFKDRNSATSYIKYVLLDDLVTPVQYVDMTTTTPLKTLIF